jgi:hypothetical protein
MVAAVFLGVFFALQSGTLESIVYDTVLEETGDSDAFERTIARVRVLESIALVASALAGGVIAQLAPLRTVYFLTAPLLVLSIVALLAFREPRLHKSEEPQSLRAQIGDTYRTILSGGHLRAVVALTIAGSVLVQGMLEFGPLWLVALLVPPFLFGPHWAGLTAALGIGGLLGARAWFTTPTMIRLVAVAVVACGVVLTVSEQPLVVVGVQIALTLLLVAVSIPVTRSLHDAIPSAIRAGVASGVGTLTWLTFVPIALAVGFVSEVAGIGRAGWLFVAIGIVAAVLILVVLPRARPTPEEGALALAAEPPAGPGGFEPDRFLPPDDPDWPGHWAIPPSTWDALGRPLTGAAGRSALRQAIADLPPDLRQVMVLRDVEGRDAGVVRQIAGITPDQERARLEQARRRVRASLERSDEGAG